MHKQLSTNSATKTIKQFFFSNGSPKKNYAISSFQQKREIGKLPLKQTKKKKKTTKLKMHLKSFGIHQHFTPTGNFLFRQELLEEEVFFCR